MALVSATLYERVKEESTSTSTGDFTLSGAAVGYATFDVAFGTNVYFYYQIEAVDAQETGIPSGDWEVGLGYLSTATNLKREWVLSSSNNGSLVDFAAGDKFVFNQLPAIECNCTQNSAFNLVFGMN